MCENLCVWKRRTACVCVYYYVAAYENVYFLHVCESKISEDQEFQWLLLNTHLKINEGYHIEQDGIILSCQLMSIINHAGLDYIYRMKSTTV